MTLPFTDRRLSCGFRNAWQPFGRSVRTTTLSPHFWFVWFFSFPRNVLSGSLFSLPSPPQFFQRPQIQPPRAALQNSSPSIRPGAQTPTAVYQTNQHIMMVNHLPMPYPMPQGPQYCIPQVRTPKRKLNRSNVCSVWIISRPTAWSRGVKLSR